MARHGGAYKSDKRRKELLRQKKQEEKRQRRLKKDDTNPQEHAEITGPENKPEENKE